MTWNVGDLVYPAYMPTKVGRIIEIKPGSTLQRPKQLPFRGPVRLERLKDLRAAIMRPRPQPEEMEDYTGPGTVIIKRLNGETFEHSEFGLNNYRQLIEDHRRKLATHEAMLAKLETMA